MIILIKALDAETTLFLIASLEAEDGIRDAQESRGLGDVYKRQEHCVLVVQRELSRELERTRPRLIHMYIGLGTPALRVAYSARRLVRRRFATTPPTGLNPDWSPSSLGMSRVGR